VETHTEATTKPLGMKMEIVEANTSPLLTPRKADTLDYLDNNIDMIEAMLEKFIATTQTNTEATTNYITIDLMDDKHLKPKPKS
jgi:hypothetical protein